MRRLALLLTLSAACLLPSAGPARAGAVLDRVRAAGALSCGVLTEIADYTHLDAHGPMPEFGQDVCRAIAAAVLGEHAKANFLSFPIEADGFDALAAGKIDVLMGAAPSLVIARTRGIAFGRPLFIDGEGFLVRRRLNISHVEELADSRICFIPSTLGNTDMQEGLRRRHVGFARFPFEEWGEMEAAFVGGRCDAMAGSITQLAESRTGFGAIARDFMLLPERLSSEAMAPAVPATDPEWRDAVDYTGSALIQAETFGITQANVEARRQDPDPAVRRLLGTDPVMGRMLGLPDTWAVSAIAAVGNYGEVYDRTLGDKSDSHIARGPNLPWNRGGALVPLPFR